MTMPLLPHIKQKRRTPAVSDSPFSRQNISSVSCVVKNSTILSVVSIVGFDTETKPCFTREAALASTGPDTLQLAVADGNCLVLHLSRMERLQDLLPYLLSSWIVEDAPTNNHDNAAATTSTIHHQSVTELLQLQQETVLPSSSCPERPSTTGYSDPPRKG